MLESGMVRKSKLKFEVEGKSSASHGSGIRFFRLGPSVSSRLHISCSRSSLRNHARPSHPPLTLNRLVVTPAMKRISQNDSGSHQSNQHGRN